MAEEKVTLRTSSAPKKFPAPFAAAVSAIAVVGDAFHHRAHPMSWPVVLLAFAAVAGGIVVLAMLKVGGDADSAFQAYRGADEHDDKA